MDQNFVVLSGVVTQDPRINFSPSGSAVFGCSLKTARSWMKNGERQERSAFHDIVAFGPVAEQVAQSVVKGSGVTVIGRLEYRKDQNGSWKAQVVADSIAMSVGASTVPAEQGGFPWEGGGNG